MTSLGFEKPPEGRRGLLETRRLWPVVETQKTEDGLEESS
jgi:hypothetical protein